MDEPLSETSVSIKLAEIQKRCNKLMEEPEDALELTLAEPDGPEESADRYNLKR
jgi:hypothetical protein